MDKSDILCYNTEKSIEDIDAAMQSYFFKQYSTYDKEYGNKDWLYINNFGFYRNLTKSIRTSRAVPRADYHLLYVASGELSVNGALLQSGDAYLFLPNEPHAYTYKPAEGSLYYWVHFTGNRVAELLSRGEIAGGVNKSNERKTEKDEVLSLLTAELGKCAEEASRYAVSLFFSFLCLFEGGCRRRFYAKALRELESMTGNATVGEIGFLNDILANINVFGAEPTSKFLKAVVEDGAFNLNNSYWPLIILSLTGLGFKNGLYVFMLRQFFMGVPNELEESAYIDGSGVGRTFLQIILPLSVPMMITVFLFAFSWQWTDDFYTELFFTTTKTVLMPDIIGIPTTLETNYAGQSLYYAAIRNTCGLMIIAPLVIMYLFCQNFLVQGIERSGLTAD